MNYPRPTNKLPLGSSRLVPLLPSLDIWGSPSLEAVDKHAAVTGCHWLSLVEDCSWHAVWCIKPSIRLASFDIIIIDILDNNNP